MEYLKYRQELFDLKTLHEDVNFPAINDSLFYHQIPAIQFEWRRPQEIFTNPKFIVDDTKQFDVFPGRCGIGFFKITLPLGSMNFAPEENFTWNKKACSGRSLFKTFKMFVNIVLLFYILVIFVRLIRHKINI
uniref:Calpain catalytic domain-containing protein n=1 Tax=Romanomermis culicivorax TaxID=13658 RepID=A0A915L3Q5_ROMCU